MHLIQIGHNSNIFFFVKKNTHYAFVQYPYVATPFWLLIVFLT